MLDTGCWILDAGYSMIDKMDKILRVADEL